MVKLSIPHYLRFLAVFAHLKTPVSEQQPKLIAGSMLEKVANRLSYDPLVLGLLSEKPI